MPFWKQTFAKRMECVHHQIAVAEHDSLGAAGGAAGVEDAAEIAADPHRIGHRRAALDQLFEIVHASRRLAEMEGILCGVSSGAILHAACLAAKELGTGKRVLAILPDTGERYLSTELFS